MSFTTFFVAVAVSASKGDSGFNALISAIFRYEGLKASIMGHKSLYRI